MRTKCTERYSGCAYCEYSRTALIGLVGTASIWIRRKYGQLNISLEIGYIGGLERNKLLQTVILGYICRKYGELDISLKIGYIGGLKWK